MNFLTEVELLTLLSLLSCVELSSLTPMVCLTGGLREFFQSHTCLSFIHSLDSSVVTELFYIFNVSGDGSISKEEFSFCYEQWIKKETIDIQKNWEKFI